jgi:hypothetical protein
MKTKRLQARPLIAGILAIFSVAGLHAQHYPAGSEGIKAGSIPAPGIYIKDYNALYFADNFQGYSEPFDPIRPMGPFYQGFKTFDYVQTPRLLWVSDWKILGANFGMSLRLPIEYKETTYTQRTPVLLGGAGGPGTGPALGIAYISHTDKQFGLADIEVQPVLLSWHLGQFDVSTGYSFWAPTGDYDKSKLFFDNLGQGYWTHMFSLGFTWYPDTGKTWAISLLNHYEINMAQYSSLVTVPVSPSAPQGTVLEDTTLGDIYTLEWAVSKSVIKDVDVGLTGYYQQQGTGNGGPARTEGQNPNGPTWHGGNVQVAGIGPEIEATIPDWGLTASLRYAYEFTAMDHFQGNQINLTVTMSFK